MKKILQKSCAWLVMLVAMFAMSMSAWAQDATFNFRGAITNSSPLVSGVVTATSSQFTAYGNGANIFRNGSDYDWNLTLTSSGANIVKIEYTLTGKAGSMTTDGVGVYTVNSTSSATWEGSAQSVCLHGYEDVDVYVCDAKVWIEGGTGTGGGGGGTTYATVVSVSPAEGDIKLDENKNGLGGITINMAGDWDRSVYAGEGNPVPDGVTLVGPDGPVTINPSYGFCMWQGLSNITVSHNPYNLTTPGTYTLTIPEGLNTIGGNPNPAMEYTWTVVAATTFEVESYLVSPDRYTTVKALPSFSVSAPDGLTFDKVQNPTTLKLQGEYDNDLGDYTYTDVLATVALDEGKAVFTFTTPYSDKASLNFKVPAGVISDANGLTSEEFSVRFSVDPYDYFTVTPSIKSSTTYAETISEIVLTVPEDVTITSVGDEIEVDDNSTLPEVEFSNETHTVTITLEDPITNGQHSIIIPLGFVKVSEYVVSREIELYSVKVLGENDPFPYTEMTPSAWSNVTNQSLAKDPVVITFAREIASVDDTKISIQTSDWTTKTVAEFNVEMPEAITLTTDGKVLSVKFSEAFLASDYFASSGDLNIKLYEGALTAKNGSVNDVYEYGIGFNFSVLKSFTMGASEWCTFSSTNYVVVPEGYTVYKVAGFDGDSVILASVAAAGTTLPYYQGFLINGPAGNVYYGTGSQWDAISVNNNYLVGNPESINTYNASDIALNKWDYQIDALVESCKLYQFSYDNNGENLGFYTQTGTDGASIEVPAGKAFLFVPERAAGSIKRFVLQDGTVITGLTAVEVPMEKDAIYNLQGQRVNATAKDSVYVKNGKKFIVK